MKLGVGFIILFLALIALAVEIVLYFIVGAGVMFSSEQPDTAAQSVIFVAFFFVWLMTLTVVTGVAAPIAGAIEQFGKKPNLGWKIFGITVLTCAVGFGLLCLILALTIKS